MPVSPAPIRLPHKLMSRCFFLTLIALGWIHVHSCRGDESARNNEDLFEIHVRPVFVKHCIRCHGDEKQEGGLSLVSRGELLEGGESGPAIVLNRPEESLLLEAIRYESLEMPPDGPLEESAVAGLESWIAAGAAWPDGVKLRPTPAITKEDRDWWCYQPIADPQPPPVDGDWCRNEIDQFIHDRLAREGIQPARQSDPLTMTRRVSFALTGLPPEEYELDAAGSASFDYEGLVDRLLADAAFGENQARFWLDLVRYAETDGYRADHPRPEAYRYRDYVISAFNEDKPYDQFIREQLAGDEIAPGNRQALIATMYLRHWIYEHNQRDVETQWHEILSDITETTADVFLAQGFKCARCHDHKFDPILQKDYFRMKAFFAAFEPAENHPVADAKTRTDYQRQLQHWEDATRELRIRLEEIEQPVLLKHATREGFDKFIPKIKAMIRLRPEDRSPYEHQIASLASRQFDLPYDKLSEWLSEEQQAERESIRKQLAEFDSLKPEPLPTMKFVGSDVGPVAPVTFVPDDTTRTPIAPGFLSLLDTEDAVIAKLPASLRSTGRRTALAKWIASRDNPLTARVIVNRVWQQHFGTGLVGTSSDFGHLGTPPSHPMLLDWLARRFMDDGWSMKKLHRMILTSSTYRQSSLRPIDERLSEIDPQNRLLWRMNARRLAGEEINDTVLAASGELKKQKRAIYKPVKRNSPDPLLAAFDLPDRIRSTGKRHRTTTSPQALLLGNGDWLHQRAANIVKTHKRGDSIDRNFISIVYRKLFGRVPDSDELQMAIEFVKSYSDRTPPDSATPGDMLVAMPGRKDAGQFGSGHDGSAIDIVAADPLDLQIKPSESLPDGDFTVEAFVLLRSLHKDASVRTIVTHWAGDKTKPGWSLGVTSTKSAYKPRNLILQLVGETAAGEVHYEVVASGLRPELNKPYYLAATVDLDDPSEQGITFYLQDLSKKDAKIETAQVSHQVVSGLRPENAISIGSRWGKHQWDGLIGQIRVENQRRDLTLVAQADSVEGKPDFAFDLRFDGPENIGQDSSGNGNHAVVKSGQQEVSTPMHRAHVAFVHALLNSNELIYVD